MSENETHKMNIKTAAKVSAGHVWSLIFWNIIGYFVRAAIYAAVFYFGIQYGIENHGFPDWSWVAGVIGYIALLVLSFFLRIRAVINGMKDAALDAAEEMMSKSEHESVRTGAKGFKILRFFLG